MTIGPQTKAADALHAMKYRGEHEDFREAMNRVAFGLKDSDEHYHEFREILLHQRFLPGGRIQGAIGATRQTTPYNCFVSGTIEDSFVDGPGCIMQRAHEAAATMRMGGGIGYNFSTLRPKGELIKRLQSQSSGAPSFMRIFNEICLATSSSGHRRGAQMGMIDIDHPDIETFIRMKQKTGELEGFNISVAVTDEFMHAVTDGNEFDLRWGGKVYRTVDARALWELLMRSTWDWAEPGVVFIDNVNRMNNLWYCEVIRACNPCGEQPLPPFGACLLGSTNLVKFLRPTGLRVVHSLSQGVAYEFDFDAMVADVPAVVRAMDNVIDRARYPLPEQKHDALGKRRMGLGYTGLANAGEALGYAYGSDAFIKFTDAVGHALTHAAYYASVELAKEKGTFPLYNEEKYLAGQFIKSLDPGLQAAIKRHGIRNSHLISLAPTGTISQAADNVSSGLEPVLFYKAKRPVNTWEGPVEFQINDYGVQFLNVMGKLAADVTAAEHIAVLCTGQRWTDSAVSKTCNVSPDMPWADFKELYMQAWRGGAKGCTTFNPGGKRMALITSADDGEGAACVVDQDGRRDCA